jgi:hypothetical protein
MAPLGPKDRRTLLLSGKPLPPERKPLVPRFVVVLFAVGLVWSWALLLGWWLLRGRGV